MDMCHCNIGDIFYHKSIMQHCSIIVKFKCGIASCRSVNWRHLFVTGKISCKMRDIATGLILNTLPVLFEGPSISEVRTYISLSESCPKECTNAPIRPLALLAIFNSFIDHIFCPVGGGLATNRLPLPSVNPLLKSPKR